MTTDTPTTPITLRAFIDAARLRATVTRIEARPGADDDDWHRSASHYRVTITGPRGGSMRVHFSQGAAHDRAPKLRDVLDCIAQDASGYENARGSFEEWASEYGYDTDSRKAARTFEAVKRQACALRRVLGEEQYAALLWNVERE